MRILAKEHLNESEILVIAPRRNLRRMDAGDVRWKKFQAC